MRFFLPMLIACATPHIDTADTSDTGPADAAETGDTGPVRQGSWRCEARGTDWLVGFDAYTEAPVPDGIVAEITVAGVWAHSLDMAVRDSDPDWWTGQAMESIIGNDCENPQDTSVEFVTSDGERFPGVFGG